jgi:hypothetical protein
VDAGQLVLMKLPNDSTNSAEKKMICGLIVARLGKKKPQNYEVYAENDIWIATELDLIPFKVHRLDEIRLS